MPDEYRVTIRLSPALYIQREARGSHYPPGARRLPDAAARPPNKCRRGRNDVGSHGSQHRGTPRADAGDAGTAGYVGGRPAARTRQPAAADRAADADAAYARMQALQPQGLSLAQIAAQLTAEGLRTRHGKPWHKSTVAYVLKTPGR